MLRQFWRQYLLGITEKGINILYPLIWSLLLMLLLTWLTSELLVWILLSLDITDQPETASRLALVLFTVFSTLVGLLLIFKLYQSRPVCLRCGKRAMKLERGHTDDGSENVPDLNLAMFRCLNCNAYFRFSALNELAAHEEKNDKS